jgi:uncharacterized DUF497 family protein
MISWDSEKARTNELKHGIRFSDAEAVLSDPHSITIEDQRHGEQRFVTVGSDIEGRILIVVYSYPENANHDIRIISARRALPSERRMYEQEK